MLIKKDLTISSVKEHQNKLKICVLGSQRVGKSAVSVRYLTKRYIGEYSSNKDFVYRHSVSFDNITTEVEIMDTAFCKTPSCLYEHVTWADAFVLVYSICDRSTFEYTRHLVETISTLKGLVRGCPIILLGNKRDLEHARQVGVDDGQEMSLRFQCQFYEVSAAENYVGVSLAFQSLIRESRALQIYLQALKTLPIRRPKIGAAMTVSKMIGMVFGKNGKLGRNGQKKRPSLSI